MGDWQLVSHGGDTGVVAVRLLVGLDNEMMETELLKGLGVGEELTDCEVGDEATGLWKDLGVGGGLMGLWIDRGVREEVTGL